MNLQTINASASPEVQINENFDSLDFGSVYGKRPAATTGLTWGYYGGYWSNFAITAGTLTLTNSIENYISVARATGVISVEATVGSPSVAPTNWNNTAQYARVYKLWVSGGVVTSIEDHRAGLYGTQGAFLAATSPTILTSLVTTSTTFTAFAGATTLLTLGGTGATSVLNVPGTLDASGTTGALTVAGGVYVAKKILADSIQTAGTVYVGTQGRFLAAASSTPASLTSLEVYYSSSGETGAPAGFIRAYDRTGLAYKPLITDSSTFTVNISGVSGLSIDASKNTTLAAALIGPATATVFNTVSTTVNAFGAASTALNIGHASGTNTVLGATTFSQALAVYAAGAQSLLTIGGNAASTIPEIQFKMNSAARYNFQLGIGVQANDAFTITPSTAVGGTTFTTPGFKVDYLGAVTIPGTLGVTGAITTNAVATITDLGNVSAFKFESYVSNSAEAGSITRVAQTAVVTFNTTSDERLKTDMGIATDTSVLRALKIHDFTWKENGVRGIGVFAQEAHKVWADPITVGGDDPKTKPWGAGYSTYVPHLIVGWQDHERRLQALESKLH